MKTLINYIVFILTNKNTFEAYLTMRKSYMIFHEYKYFNFICFINSVVRKKYNIKTSTGVLGFIDSKRSKTIVDEINKNGFIVFDEKISDEIILKLYSFAEQTPIHFLEVREDQKVEYSNFKESYSKGKNKSIRHQFNDTKDIFESKEARNLYFDSTFLHIANDYLNSRPWVDIFTMWWSTPINKIDDKYKHEFIDSAAQMFHYDLDRLKFLKFFIYLTDVNEENGPHVYVKGSHLKPFDFINYDGRYSDDLIFMNQAENIVKLTGKKGTIMAVDTRGIHKGLELLAGERLIYQLQFTNSLFGTRNYKDYKDKYHSKCKNEFQGTYSLFVNFQK